MVCENFLLGIGVFVVGLLLCEVCDWCIFDCVWFGIVLDVMLMVVWVYMLEDVVY